MRFVVVGAGGVGGVMGARLHQSGHDVVLVARGRHLEVIQQRGLRLVTAAEDVTLRIPAAGHPGDIGLTTDDVVIVATKSHQSAAALEAVRQTRVDVPVVCAQNGVANEREALRWFAAVYGMMVVSPCEHLEPGVVRNYGGPYSGILDLGRYPRGVDAVAEEVAAALRASTYLSTARDDVMPWKYLKLLQNLSNAVEALCGPEHTDGRLKDLAIAEARHVFAAAGISVASREDHAAQLDRMGPVDRNGHGGSSWQSVVRGTGDIETDHFNGEIVLLGRLHGIDTPVNALLQREAHAAAERRDRPGVHTEQELIDRVTATSAVSPRRPPPHRRPVTGRP